MRASDRSIPTSRPAFYALRPGGWRDYVTLLHPPYTAWHLSYVVVGGCLAAEVDWWTLGLTVLAFALAMGVGAHALDELDGRRWDDVGETGPGVSTSSTGVGRAVGAGRRWVGGSVRGARRRSRARPG